MAIKTHKKTIQWLHRITANPEGRIFMLGLITSTLFLCWLGLSYFWLQGKTRLLFAMASTCIMFGRVVGMYFGFTAGLPNLVIITVNVLVDTLWVLLLYPVVILSMKNLMTFKLLERNIERIINITKSSQERIKRYGIPGLFFFVLCPLPMTGPVVGGAIGYFMGLQPLVNMAVVLSATYTMIVIWAFILPEIHQRMEAHSPAISVIFLIILVVLVLIGRLAHKYTINDHQSKVSEH